MFYSVGISFTGRVYPDGSQHNNRIALYVGLMCGHFMYRGMWHINAAGMATGEAAGEAAGAVAAGAVTVAAGAVAAGAEVEAAGASGAAGKVEAFIGVCGG